MTEVLRVSKAASPKKAVERGLEPGYAEDKWGPWKSHKLLLIEAIQSVPEWRTRAGVLSRTFAAFGRSRPGFLSEKEFSDILTSFVCCEEIFFHHFFQLFDRDQDGFISEIDFLSGMLAVSPVTDHDLTKPSGLLRLQFIFLYYDANRNGRLDIEELSLMIEHLEQLRSEQAAVEKGPKLEMRQIAVNDAKSLMALYKGGFWYKCLHDACFKGMLSGLEQLLRTAGDLADSILRINPQLASEQPPVFNASTTAAAPPKPVQQTPREDFPPTNQVTIQPPQTVVTKQQEASFVAAAPARKSIPGYPPPHPNVSMMSGVTQTKPNSSNSSLALRVVRGLMDFSANPHVDWRSIRSFWGVNFSDIIQLCDTVMPILQAEDSLVSVPFPARMYGDIHGNLPDLVQFFNKYAWPDKRKGDILSMNYVFLGDFVDRGSFSVEVITLLFSLKILYPTKIFLIRGNHEDRNMNYNYGFRKSCLEIFGSVDGPTVWERVNECFDYLPLAGLVGSEVLCIHGGIGEAIDSVSDLVGIEKPIIVPPESVDPATLNKVDKVVIDALWSDPFEPNNGTAGGRTHMSPRGNGASRFSADKVKRFVNSNNLQFIVRAHECVQNGYEYFADGLVLTIFSASSYCNQYNNDGGMVVVVKNEDGSLEEHAQIIKSNQDTRIAWDIDQFKQPTPIRSMNVISQPQMLPGMYQQPINPMMMMTGQYMQRSRIGLPFVPVTYPASPGSARLF